MRAATSAGARCSPGGSSARLAPRALRRKYDEGLRARHAAPEPPPLQWATTPAPHQPQPSQPPPPSPASQDRPAASHSPSSAAGSDFVKRAAMLKLREAVDAVLGGSESPAAGFDPMLVSKPKEGFFLKGDEGVRLLVR